MSFRDMDMESEDPRQRWWLSGDDICSYDSLGNVTHLSQRELQQQALAIIRQRPNGIRFMELANEVRLLHPETPSTSIPGALNPIGRTLFAEQVTKPERGLFLATEIATAQAPDLAVREEDFYRPIA
ncbi:MAG: hypothetical protein MUF54_15535, partial [Polyangiaceae bacterium]|nr:hypothetical protein [Polyangiaceae bacterium]